MKVNGMIHELVLTAAAFGWAEFWQFMIELCSVLLPSCFPYFRFLLDYQTKSTKENGVLRFGRTTASGSYPYKPQCHRDDYDLCLLLPRQLSKIQGVFCTRFPENQIQGSKWHHVGQSLRKGSKSQRHVSLGNKCTERNNLRRAISLPASHQSGRI